MEKVAKILLISAIMLVVLASDVEGGRKLKDHKEENVDHPQNFIGGIGGTGIFPSPGFTGVGFGPSVFCTFPGGCTPTPTLPFNPITGGSPPHAQRSQPLLRLKIGTRESFWLWQKNYATLQLLSSQYIVLYYNSYQSTTYQSKVELVTL